MVITVRPLPIELVRTWLSYKPQNIQDKILKNLLIHGFIYQVAENILTIDPTTVIPNEDIVRAGWVLSRLDGIDPHAHYPARFPAQIHFLSHQFGVDIMVIHPGSEHLVYLLESSEQLKYIFGDRGHRAAPSCRTGRCSLYDCLRSHPIPYHFLYQEGFHRCPLPTNCVK